VHARLPDCRRRCRRIVEPPRLASDVACSCLTKAAPGDQHASAQAATAAAVRRRYAGRQAAATCWRGRLCVRTPSPAWS